MGLTFDWTLKLSDFVAVFALAVSASSFFLSWTTRRDNRLGGRPVVGIQRDWDDGDIPASWQLWTLTLRSRDNQGHRAAEIALRGARHSRLATQSDGMEWSDRGRYVWRAAGPPEPARSIVPDLRVTHAGSAGESGKQGIMILVPQGRPQKAALTVKLVGDSDGKTTVIRRTIELRYEPPKPPRPDSSHLI